MSTERGPSGPHLDPEGGAGVPARQDSQVTDGGHGVPPHQLRPRNIWRDGLWIGATAFVIITIGALYQTWLHLGPEGREKRAELKGDGVNVESYGFDLSELAPGIERSSIVATGKRKDEVPVLDDSGFITVEENAALTGHEKYVLPTDRVIGIAGDSYSLTYPIQVMQVHQIVNDATSEWIVTAFYDPMTELVTAFHNERDEDIQRYDGFGMSGLAYKGVPLVFNRVLNEVTVINADTSQYSVRTTRTVVAEQSLWSPTQRKAIAGPMVSEFEGPTLFGQWDVSVLQWRDWVKLHPDTLILKRDENYLQQYKKDTYGPYYRSEKLISPVAPQMTSAQLQKLELDLKSRGIGLLVKGREYSDTRKIFVPHVVVLANASFTGDDLGTWTVNLDDIRIDFECRSEDIGFTPSTVWITNQPEIGSRVIPLVMLFAWFANYPDTYILQADGTLVKP